MVPTYNSSTDDLTEVVRRIHDALSFRGDLVTPAGRALTVNAFGEALSPLESVDRICAEVYDQGFDAVAHYTSLFDGAHITPDDVRVPIKDLESAHAAADSRFLQAVRHVRDNIVEFQSAIIHRDRELDTRYGSTLAQRYTPLQRVGLCVPGGTAAYPSTVLMTAVPALVAGVPEIAVVAPPTPLGAFNKDILATCHELGIQEVYRVGGAQGVAALAYGITNLPKVDKIVGPGNLFVALAKKHVYGAVDIDSIAGPSEVTVVADHTANPQWVASELMAQVEHAPGSAVLVTWEAELLRDVADEIEEKIAQLDRREAIEHGLSEFSALCLVRNEREACELTNQIAPEHLQLAVDQPEAMSHQIVNAGATFLGHYSPVALGDYIAGPSHVLPTGGTARWASGLSVNSFLRSRSIIHFDQKALEQVAEDVELLATRERLNVHGYSVQIRRTPS